jgi:hypothetical protein
MFTVQDSRRGTRGQLVGGAVEVQVADAFLTSGPVSAKDSSGLRLTKAWQGKASGPHTGPELHF